MLPSVNIHITTYCSDSLGRYSILNQPDIYENSNHKTKIFLNMP